jgi:hypothetical protein
MPQRPPLSRNEPGERQFVKVHAVHRGVVFGGKHDTVAGGLDGPCDGRQGLSVDLPANVGARLFYGRHGFVPVATTDGDNEQQALDVGYHWPGDPGPCQGTFVATSRPAFPRSLVRRVLKPA